MQDFKEDLTKWEGSISQAPISYIWSLQVQDSSEDED